MRGMTNLLVGSGSGPTPVVPDGKTVTPTNDLAIWQQCAGLTPTYTTLGDLLSDSGYVRALMLSDNAVDYLVRSTDFAAAQTSLVPTMTSDTAPSGQCFCTSVNSSYAPYKAFDNNDSTNAVTSNGNVAASSPSWIGYMFTSPVTLSKAVVYQTSYTYTGCYIQYSNDGTTYYDASASFTLGTTRQTIEFEPATGKYWRLYLGATTAATARPIYTIQFYSGSVVHSETAMAYIGTSDYAASTLLNDSTWFDAILNSTYNDKVFNVNVPTMTSNTTPSGECYYTFINYSSNPPYYAFDKNINTKITNNGTTTRRYCRAGYKFTHQVKLMAFMYQGNQDGNLLPPTELSLEASNDNSTYVRLSPVINPTADINKHYVAVSDYSETYQYYSLYCYDRQASNNSYYTQFAEINFYGREVGGVQTWLYSAGITNKSYTSLSQVLEDSTSLATLMSSQAAVDYLVTATGWATDVCANQNAMSYIGLNNYAANTLLADATWRAAICNSTYFESVLNVKVPVMTSATAPSGQVYANPTYQTNYGYYAFDQNTNTKWLGSTPPASYSGNYIAYRFPTVKTIYMARIRQYSGTTTPDAQATADIQAGISNANFETVKSNITWYQRSTALNWYTFAFDTIKTNCDTFRILYISGTQANAINSGMSELQFYGRVDV